MTDSMETGGGAAGGAGGGDGEPPRNPLPFESLILDDLSEQLPPRGSFDSESPADVALLHRFWSSFHRFGSDAGNARI